MRKIGMILVALVLLVIGAIYYFSPSENYTSKNCPFCNPQILEKQMFYEDDLVLALCTHRPVFPGHCLVIPKRHVERFEDLTEAEICQIGCVLKKVNRAVVEVYETAAYVLLQKNGVEAGQSVPHVHFHYIPRKAGDKSIYAFFVKMYLANAKSPISSEEMQKTVAKLKQAISNDSGVCYEPLASGE